MNTIKPRPKLFSLLLAALAILFVIVVQASHFHQRPYRQDEAWVIHFALANIEDVGFFNHILMPLYELVPENVLQDIWIHLFGHHERITRHLSSLLTMLALAMICRLGSDLYDRHTGWLAILLLGTYGIFAYYGHEARPYSLMVFGAVSFTWALLRFIELPSFKRGVFAWLIAALAVFTHPFMAFLLASQLVCVVVFVPWDRFLFRRGAVLYALLGLLVAYRGYINFTAHQGAILYNLETSWAGLSLLYEYFRFEPAALGLLLFLGGLATLLLKLASTLRPSSAPAHSTRVWLGQRMRFPSFWREGWFALSFALMLAMALLFNLLVPSLTPRNVLILAPSIVLIAAMALRQMPRHLQLILLIMLCLPFIDSLRIEGGNAGYPEMTAWLEERYQPGRDSLVVAAESMWEIIPINYYLQERSRLSLGAEDIFFISRTLPLDDPMTPQAFDASLSTTGFDAEPWPRLRDFVGESQRVWLIEGNPYDGAQKLIASMEQEYTLYGAIDFPGETYYRALKVLEYRRQPEFAEPLMRFGKDIALLHWQLNTEHSVPACARISLDTWWSTEAALDDLYSTTLVIAGADGNGIANADDVPGGIYPTSLWQPGQIYFDERVLTIPCDTAAGEYPLLLGMYALPIDEQPLEMLPIHTSAGEPTGRRYEYLTTLQVQP